MRKTSSEIPGIFDTKREGGGVDGKWEEEEEESSLQNHLEEKEEEVENRRREESPRERKRTKKRRGKERKWKTNPPSLSTGQYVEMKGEREKKRKRKVPSDFVSLLPLLFCLSRPKKREETPTPI